MPFHHSVDRERKLIHFTAGGEEGVEELVEAMRALMDEPDFGPGYDALIDVSRLTPAPSVTHLKIRSLSDFIKSIEARVGRARWAFHAPGFIQHSLTHMLKQLVRSDSIEMRIFRDLPQAEEWLHGRAGR